MGTANGTKVSVDSETGSLTLFSKNQSAVVSLSADAKTITLGDGDGKKNRLVLGLRDISVFFLIF